MNRIRITFGILTLRLPLWAQQALWSPWWENWVAAIREVALAVAPRVIVCWAVLSVGCAPGEFGAGAKMANTVLAGAACGMAAANDTPCTPRAVLDALARDAAAQKAKVEAVAPQASAADPELTKAILAQLEANTASNKKLTEAIVLLAVRAPESVPTAPTSSALPAAPAAPPAPTAAPVPAVTP